MIQDYHFYIMLFTEWKLNTSLFEKIHQIAAELFFCFNFIFVYHKSEIFETNLIICDWNLLRKLNQQFSELYQILDGESSYQCEGEGAEVRGEQKEEHDPTQCDDSPATPSSKLFYHDLPQILRQAKD